MLEEDDYREPDPPSKGEQAARKIAEGVLVLLGDCGRVLLVRGGVWAGCDGV